MDVLKDRNFHFFDYKNASLCYSVSGKGANIIFCFHGFGLTGKSFNELEELLSKEYTFYNFDLPHHGQSKWRSGEEPLSDIFWKEWLQKFCDENNIQTFSLLGYSIGARFVWSAVLSFPYRIKEVIVLAPDGIKNSFWYTLATHSVLSRELFKLLLSNAGYINSFLKLGRFLRLVPKLTARFAESQLITKEQRERVYMTWVTFRTLKVDTTKLSETVNQHSIPLTIYLGAQDRIITFNTVRSLVEKVHHKNVVTIPSVHSNLIHQAAEYLRKKGR